MSAMEEIFEGYEPFDKEMAKSRAPKNSVAADNAKSPKHAGAHGSGHHTASRVKGGGTDHKKNKTEAKKSFSIPAVDSRLFKAVTYEGDSMYSEMEQLAGLK